MRLGRWYIGWQWGLRRRLGPWLVSEHEYWTRYVLGPVYLLRYRASDAEATDG